MFKSAFNYLADAAGVQGSAAGGAGAGGSDATADGGPSAAGPAAAAAASDPIVGSRVDVGGAGVRVTRRIGEGGFAFVYAVEAEDGDRRKMALKRLLAVDQEKKNLIIQEIAFLKGLKECPHVLQFITAANIQKGYSANKCEEFLMLTELCVASLYDYLYDRPTPYPPVTVARIFFQTLEAVNFMHRSSPPIAHRDLKIENLLIDTQGKIKLCDFGSATTKTYCPDVGWNARMRNEMEEELEKNTTPMYRAPEMWDVWSNYRVDHLADVWALGCVLFQLCFRRHPFPDGSKLAVVNANFKIPADDQTHRMFHDLIRQTLVEDPANRPTVQQMLEHLGEVAIMNSWDLEEKIDFERTAAESPMADVSSPAGPQPPGPSSNQQFQGQGNNRYPSPKPERPSPVQGGGGHPSAQQQSQQQQRAGGYSSAGLFSSMKGAGSSVLGKVRESTKVLVGTLMASRDLDISIVTTRVVCTSYPSDGGLDLTSYKNQIEEVRQILETHHADHYAVANLTERRYPHSRFARGKVIDADWSTSITPTVEQLLKLTMQVLEFLGQNKKNVVVIHCLDGRSNTAMLFTGIMLVARVFTSYRDALALFEAKRGPPVLSFGQRNVLKQLDKALRGGKREVELTKQPVTVTSVILEPVPLFTKAGDGARPFVDVYCDGNLVATSFRDYASLRLFTPYDGDAAVAANVRVPPGDVTVAVYHARQSIAGSLLSSASSSASGVTKIKICQVYFNPALVPPNRTHVRFPTHELDELAAAERIPADFAVTVNFSRKDPSRTERFPYLLPERRKLDLVFESKAEFADACAAAGVADSARESDQPRRPPREKHSPGVAASTTMPKPSSLVDIASLNEPSSKAHLPVSDQLKEQRKPSSLVDIGGADDGQIVDNIFPEHPPTETQARRKSTPQDDVLLDLGGSQAGNSARQPDPFGSGGGGGNVADLLGGFSSSTTTTQPRVPQPGTGASPSSDPALLNDLFGGPAAASQPRVPQPGSSGSATTQQSPLINDLFGAPPAPAPSSSTGLMGDPFGGAPSSSNGGNLLGDILSPSGIPAPTVSAAPQPSASEQMVDEMLNKLSVNQNQSSKPAAAAAKPNYNSAFFGSSSTTTSNSNGGSMSKPPSRATFDDLLGGFAPTTDPNAGKTIGEMKKAEEKRDMTPDEARVFEWTHGKSRNLRALLCSLDKVLWEGSRWEQCGMHQLVSFADVKRMHRRACLAVHPDKQTGTENEALAKAVITELNDAWAKFQEDEGR